MVSEPGFKDIYVRPWSLNHVFWMYIYVCVTQRVNKLWICTSLGPVCKNLKNNIDITIYIVWVFYLLPLLFPMWVFFKWISVYIKIIIPLCFFYLYIHIPSQLNVPCGKSLYKLESMKRFFLYVGHLLQCFQKKYTSEFWRICCNCSMMKRFHGWSTEFFFFFSL